MEPKLRELLKAYEAAEYVVDPFGDESVLIVLDVGEPAPELDLLLQDEDRGRESWAFVTAFNPGSERLADEVNREAQGRLLRGLEAEGRRYWPGWGQSPDGRWREESVLIRGMSRKEAVRLGRELGQVAVLVGEVGGLAELVLCGDPAPSP